ncbi:hypothetical protein ACFSQ7_40730 [Paenibacillus rhizoplanae]
MNFADINENDVIYRCIGNDFNQGIVSCGFMRKKDQQSVLNMIFKIGYYSCFVVLQGSGTFISTDGTVTPMQAGDLVQRLPERLHSTAIEPDGNWIEFLYQCRVSCLFLLKDTWNY